MLNVWAVLEKVFPVGNEKLNSNNLTLFKQIIIIFFFPGQPSYVIVFTYCTCKKKQLLWVDNSAQT